MIARPDARLVWTVLSVGFAYYAGAWLGVHQTITPEGIAILWPPNAILLAAFLILPYRQLPFIGLAAMLAEIIADVPAFPLWSAVAFGLVNLFEVSLAAILIRRFAGEPFGLNHLHGGIAFLLFGPLLASALAGLLGAGIYLLLGRADTSYLALWRLWWFGDALGLLLLAPLVVTVWRWLAKGIPTVCWPKVAELGLLWLLVMVFGLLSFTRGTPGELVFHFTPLWLIPLGIWAAVRFGVLGATATVVLIAALAVGHLMHGIHPYVETVPQYAVWKTQEYLAILSMLSVGLAILWQEIISQRESLVEKEQALKTYNLALEQRVRERTSELERANRQLARTATTDELTGIANRRHLLDEARRELERLRHAGQAASVIMLDLDYFKDINDQYGHEAGDVVLSGVIEPIQQAIRPRDLLGRVGGEEFVIFLSAMERIPAIEVAERIRAAVEAWTVEYRGRPIPVRVSLGVAQWDGMGELDALIRQADKALYMAKKRGRNQVASFDAQ